MKTRQMLAGSELQKYALEINIAPSSPILDELRPHTVPSLILVSADKEILYIKTGLPHPEELKTLASVISSID